MFFSDFSCVDFEGGISEREKVTSMTPGDHQHHASLPAAPPARPCQSHVLRSWRS